MTLSLHMNERGGSCFPSIETVAKESGLHAATVKRALNRLEEDGWLKRDRKGKGGRGRVTTYTALLPPELAQLAPDWPPVESAGNGAGSAETGAGSTRNRRTERQEVVIRSSGGRSVDEERRANHLNVVRVPCAACDGSGWDLSSGEAVPCQVCKQLESA